MLQSWINNCNKCGAKRSVEVKSDKEKMFHSEFCWNCKHKGDVKYYKDRDNNILLLSKENARERKLLSICPKCKGDITYSEWLDYKMCKTCHEKM